MLVPTFRCVIEFGLLVCWLSPAPWLVWVCRSTLTPSHYICFVSFCRENSSWMTVCSIVLRSFLPKIWLFKMKYSIPGSSCYGTMGWCTFFTISTSAGFTFTIHVLPTWRVFPSIKQFVERPNANICIHKSADHLLETTKNYILHPLYLLYTGLVGHTQLYKIYYMQYITYLYVPVYIILS